MKNNLTPPDEAVVVPDLSRQWLTQPIPVDDLVKLDPIMNWRLDPEFIDSREWDFYANKPSRRDSLPEELIEEHMERLAPIHKEEASHFSSSSALHSLARIPGEVDSSEFHLLNAYPMSV